MLNRVITRIGGLLILAVILTVSCHKKEEPVFNEDRMEEVCKRVEEATSLISEYYHRSNSIEDFLLCADDILQVDGVEDLYANETNVVVRIAGFGKIIYLFEDSDRLIEEDDDNLVSNEYNKGTLFASDSNFEPNTKALSTPNAYLDFMEVKKICVVNQQASDEGRKRKNSAMDLTARMFQACGFPVFLNNYPTISFFGNELFNYDIVFINTHGCYDWNDDEKQGYHWIATAEELRTNDAGGIDSESMKPYLIYPDDQVTVLTGSEVRDGDSLEVYHLAVSEFYISASRAQFSNYGNSIVFMGACESLLNGEELGDAFREKGAGLYFGYDAKSHYGAYAGLNLFSHALSGMSIQNAFSAIPIHMKIEKYVDENYLADLCTVPSVGSELLSKTIVRPKLGDPVFTDDYSIVLKASMSLFGSVDNYSVPGTQYNYLDEEMFYYGIEVCESNDFCTADLFGGDLMQIGSKDCKYDSWKVYFQQEFDLKDLRPETKYYYRAFVFDGKDYCVSQTGDFTTKRINQVIPPDILDQMDDYIPIYDGVNPPNVEGQYLLSPAELTLDTTNNFEIGHVFSDVYFQFRNQDMVNNTLDYAEKQESSSQTGTGAFISGEGDKFSVFFNTVGTSVYDGYTIPYKTALVISGIITSKGIEDLTYAFVMVEKQDAPKPYLMDVGGFRVIKDSDGLCTRSNAFNSPALASKGLPYNLSPLPGIHDRRR
jgi:hypothetical protein